MFSTSVQLQFKQHPLTADVPQQSLLAESRDWQALNIAINRKLIHANPPGSACFKSQPNYNAAACSHILFQWHNSNLHLQNLISIDYSFWAGDSYLPIFENGTIINGGLRTGEKGCLGIWTCNIRGIKFHPNFQRPSCSGDKGDNRAQMAATIEAEKVSYDMLQELAKHGAMAYPAGIDHIHPLYIDITNPAKQVL
ncbi:hypothetical protein EMCG_08499 [[Emmonsia] crescens]|uniref:Uncharacterized protein n=1 Tax=[Emmonsia] crescens TaxID=73230 RepID=A0A0G2JAF9_9EURO|nr:hypothetical protein EMCG_08499 [Emmonsia crescens UAMH 3008]